MTPDVRQLAKANDGVLEWGIAVMLAPKWVLTGAVRRGELVRLFPRVYVLADAATDATTRARAALAFVGRDAALSHLTAVAAWQLPAPAPPTEITVTSWSGRRLRVPTDCGLRVHRRNDALPVVIRGGLPTVPLEHALLGAWRAAGDPYRREVMTTAVRTRRTTPSRIRQALAQHARLRDRRVLLRLLRLLDEGCQSHLELFGYTEVFAHRCMPTSVGQLRIQLSTRVVYLDRAFVAEKVAVELDGATYHSSRRDRERDMRRDAELAAQGWLVLRYSHAQLTSEPDVVRAEILTVLAARRAQLGLG